MENQNIGEIDPNTQNENMVVAEKKHDIAWVVSQIVFKQIIVGIPVSIVFLIIIVLIIAATGTNIEAISQRAVTDVEFAKQLQFMNQIISAALFPLTYIGTRWGCKYVAKSTYIEPKDYGKIGYWVGLVPIIMGSITGNLMVGALFFGIFLTPKLVKKWLTQFSGNLN